MAAVPIGGKFCSKCGSLAFSDEEAHSPSEVTIDWLRATLEEQGYSVDAQKNGDDPLIARNSGNATVLVGYKPEARIFTMEVIWTLKKPGWGKKGEFLAAINKANSQHWLCSFYASTDMTSISASTGMWISEKITKRDVIGCLDVFLAGSQLSIERSGLLGFA
jgi:hypothetical protein